jgi:hypothetical protein
MIKKSQQDRIKICCIYLFTAQSKMSFYKIEMAAIVYLPIFES